MISSALEIASVMMKWLSCSVSEKKRRAGTEDTDPWAIASPFRNWRWFDCESTPPKANRTILVWNPNDQGLGWEVNKKGGSIPANQAAISGDLRSSTEFVI